MPACVTVHSIPLRCPQVLLELSLPGSSTKLAASGWEVLACSPELEPEMIITLYCPCHLPINFIPRTKEEGY